MTRNVTALVLSCLLALSVMAGTAHAQVMGGSLIGGLEDAQGGALPGVILTINSPALDAPQTTFTDGTGGYRFINLPPGTYELTAELDGFATYVEQGLRVRVGGTIERNVSLELATVTEMITVTGESPVVDPRRVGVSDNLERENMETIPVHNLMATEYGKWVGGVSANDPAGRGANLSVMGSATSENTVLYDGVMVQNISSGGGWGSGDLDAMEEIEIVTLGASAEYQVAQGGVFNVVFKSGTNQWRGDAHAFFYTDTLLSKPTKLPCNCPLGETGYTIVANHNYSGHGGGPIVRDRAFFWAGGNIDKQKVFAPGTDPDPPLGRRFQYSDAYFGKATVNITDQVRAKGGFWGDYWGGFGSLSVERPLETQVSPFGLVNTYMSELTVTLGNNTLLTVRATGWIDNYPTRQLDKNKTFALTSPQRIDDDTGQRSEGIDNFGRNELYRQGQSVKINRFIQRDTMSHDLRGGVQLEQGNEARFFVAPGGVVFHDFAGLPDEIALIEPDLKGAQSRTFGAWAEDALTFDRLTLNLGVRYDHMVGRSQDLPAIDDTLTETGVIIQGLGELYTWNVVAPRFGVNLKLNDAGTAILRGTVGRAQRNIRTREFVGSHPGLGKVTTMGWDGVTPLSAATSVAAYPFLLSVTDPFANLPVIDPNTEAPYTDQVSLGVDTEVAPQVGVSVSYVYKYGQKQIGSVDRGGTYVEGLAVLGQGLTVPTFSRTSAAAATVITTTNGPGTFNRYHGFILNLDKRMSNNWSTNIAYTFSKAVGLETTGADPNSNTNRGGRIFEDRPQMLAAYAMYQFPGDVLMTGSYLGVSGSPFARDASVTLPQGRVDIALEPANGDFRFPRQDILSIRASKIFRKDTRQIEFGFEFQNMLQDQAHDRHSTADFFSTSFANATRWIEPRRLNFFIRSKF